MLELTSSNAGLVVCVQRRGASDVIVGVAGIAVGVDGCDC